MTGSTFEKRLSEERCLVRIDKEAEEYEDVGKVGSEERLTVLAGKFHRRVALLSEIMVDTVVSVRVNTVDGT